LATIQSLSCLDIVWSKHKKENLLLCFTHLLTEYKVNGKESMKLQAIDLPENVKTLSRRTFKDRLHLKQPLGM
jgi:hypothetical protein